MSAKRSRMLRAGIEALERRETPSTTTVTAIHGTGTAVVPLAEPVMNGRQVIATVSGNSKVLGSYTGLFNNYFQYGPPLGTGTGSLTAADGDTIDFDVRESFKPGEGANGLIPGRVTLTVTGGTGAYADVTGHGVATGLANPRTDAFRLALSLRLRS